MTEDGLFDVQIWGTVGQWVGVLATLFIAGLSLWFSQAGTRRERQRESEQHAVMLIARTSAVIDGKTRDVIGTDMTLFNAGSAPLTNVSVIFVDADDNGMAAGMFGWGVDLLGPGEQKMKRLPAWAMHNQFAVNCTDINGASWTKSRVGHLTPWETEPRRRWQFWRRG